MLRRLQRACAVAILLISSATAAASQYTPPIYPGTGPYRRVYSATGYSYMSASVYLPSTPSIGLVGSDTPYVYTGGWGTNGNTAVDAGFQYSPTFNDWSLFLSVSGVGSYSNSSPPRYAAGQTVTLQFSATPSTGGNATLQVSALGTNIYGVSSQQELTSASTVPNWGVAANDTLKRMTSIAQDTQNLSDGSYIDGVDWSNTTIGTSAATAEPWLAAETGGYQSYTSNVVSVNYVNAGSETDSISLTVPEPVTGTLAAVGMLASGFVRRRRFRPR